MKTNKTSRLARILVVAMVICLMACTMLSTVSFAANDAVNKCRDGVLQIKLNYTPDVGDPYPVGTGTGFLINEDTLLTCYHVVSLDTESIAALAAEVNKTVSEVQSRLSVTVTVSRDVPVSATIVNKSEEMDFAILRLAQPLKGKTPLAIRPSSEVEQTEQVYSIGFPATPTLMQSYNTYTSADATITEGVVNKISIGKNPVSEANTEYIQSSCNLDSGNSGGPMLDANGNVIGISQSTVFRVQVDNEGQVSEVSRSEFYHAITIDQVTEVLDVLGIAYTHATGDEPVTEPVTEPTTEPVTEPTTEPVTEPVTDPMPTLPTTPDTIPESESNGLLWIIIAVAVVVVIVIAVVVVIIIASGNKKSAPAVGAGTYTPPAPVARPIPPANNGGFAPAPTVPSQDAGETTVLSSNAGETTVLSRNAVNGGTLIRKRSGESVTINSEQFIIGRDRKSVNYCIADNSSISRNHVRLTVRNGVTYLTDLNAANGTFVNGVKAMPRQEIALKNGDKITLADEDLEYKI